MQETNRFLSALAMSELVARGLHGAASDERRRADLCAGGVGGLGVGHSSLQASGSDERSWLEAEVTQRITLDRRAEG